MLARQTIVFSSLFLFLALFSVVTHNSAAAEERWPPWQSFTEAEEAARQKALKRKAAAAAAAANNTANIKRQIEQLKGAGKFAQAVPLAQRLLTLAGRKGPQSLEVADALDTLAGLYEAQNKFAEAEPLLKRSLAIREKAPGQPGVAATRDRLAATYEKLGKPDDANAVRTAQAPTPITPPSGEQKKAEEKQAAAPTDAKAPAPEEERVVVVPEGRAMVEPEKPFSIPSADAPSPNAPPAVVEAEPAPKAIEEPFSIPSADAPSAGAPPMTAEAEPPAESSAEPPVAAPELPEAKPALPEFGAGRIVRPRMGAPRAAAPPSEPDVAAAPPSPEQAAPAPQVDEPSDTREQRPDVIGEPMPGAGEDEPATANEAPKPTEPSPPAAAPAPVPEPPVVAEPEVPDGRPAAPDDSAAAPAPPPQDLEGGSGQRRGYYNGPGPHTDGAQAMPPAGGAAPAPPPPAAAAAPPPPPPAAAPMPDPVGGAAPPENPDWQLVPVYWGTDRAVQPNAQRLAFGSDRARKLQLGIAQITVPKVHEVPNVERPWVVKIPYFDVTLYAQSEDPKKHFTVKEIKALTKEELLAQVKERLKTSTLFKDQALVFVHGYNTSFDNALYRTAQIAYDLDFDGAPFLYSWPSGGAVASYTYDRESAQASEPYLRQFLEMIVKETGAKQVSIIAHSMGNQPVMDVLRDMRNAAPEGVEISQVILAAPDVDADSFSNLAKTIQGLAKNITLYVAGNDRALIVSRNFWGSYRAGDVPPAGPLILPGIDTIDVTAASTDTFAINHSGYASNNKLLDDVGELLKTGLRPPEMRALKPGKVTTNAGDYWRYIPTPQ